MMNKNYFLKPMSLLLAIMICVHGIPFITAAAASAATPLCEGFEDITLTQGAQVYPMGWMYRSLSGNNLNAEIADRADNADRHFLKTYSDGTFCGASTESSITIGSKPIVVSFEVFLNGADSTDKQRMRAGIMATRNTNGADQAVVIDFTRDSTGAWLVSEVGSLDKNRGNVNKLLKADGSQLSISAKEAEEWQQVELVCYPDGKGNIKRVKYYINGEELVSNVSNPSYVQPSDGSFGDFVYYIQSAKSETAWFGLDNIQVREYEGEKSSAGVSFGNSPVLENMSMPVMKENGSYISGTGYWQITNDKNAYLYFNTDYRLGNSSDGSVFDITVKYNDNGEGYFVIWYDSLDYGPQIAGVEYMIGDGQEKNVTTTVEDAAFAKGIDAKGDVMISLYEIGQANSLQTPYSASPLQIKALDITKRGEKNSVLVESVVNADGNTFSYFDVNKTITNTIKNTTNISMNAEITYKLLDELGLDVFKRTEKEAIPASGSIIKTLDISQIDKCGLYKWVVEVKVNNKTTTFEEDTVCIVKTDPNGIRSEFAWINYHIERYGEEQKIIGIKQLNKANIGGARAQVHWSNYNFADAEGNPTADNFADTMPGKQLALYQQYDIPYWILLLGNNANPPTVASNVPVGETELAAWKNYCKYVMENTYKSAKVYEVWNEPDLASFNANSAGPADIAKLTNVAKEAANEVETAALQRGETADLNIGGLSVTGLWLANRRTYWLANALDAGIATGDNAMDMLNVHTYVENAPPESKKLYDTLKEYQEDIKNAGGSKNMPVLISEYGYTDTDSNVSTEDKANWIVRSALLYKANGVGEMSALYNLERKGVLDTYREDNFGLISCLYEKYHEEGKYGIPNEAYLTYAAMNYVLGGKLTDSQVITATDDLHITKFTSSKFNSDVYAMWSPSGSNTAEVDLGTDFAICYDRYGNETVIEAQDDVFRIELDEGVKYLRPVLDTASVFQKPVFNLSAIPSEGDKVKASTSVNNTNDTKYVFFIIASYSNSKLENISVEKRLVVKGESIIESGELAVSANTEKIKAFIWETDSLEPLCVSESL